jgi:hypothetical protein
MQNFQIVVVDDAEALRQLGAIPAQISETFIRENYRQLSFTEAALRRRKTGILGTMFPLSWRTSEPDMAEIARERARAPASEGDFLGVIRSAPPRA